MSKINTFKEFHIIKLFLSKYCVIRIYFCWPSSGGDLNLSDKLKYPFHILRYICGLSAYLKFQAFYFWLRVFINVRFDYLVCRVFDTALAEINAFQTLNTFADFLTWRMANATILHQYWCNKLISIGLCHHTCEKWDTDNLTFIYMENKRNNDKYLI